MGCNAVQSLGPHRLAKESLITGQQLKELGSREYITQSMYSVCRNKDTFLLIFYNDPVRNDNITYARDPIRRSEKLYPFRPY